MDSFIVQVVSGGVACNSYFRRAFEMLCQNEGYNLYIPPAKYCNDNGVMIAWNGIERFNEGIGVYNYKKVDELDIKPQYALFLLFLGFPGNNDNDASFLFFYLKMSSW